MGGRHPLPGVLPLQLAADRCVVLAARHVPRHRIGLPCRLRHAQRTDRARWPRCVGDDRDGLAVPGRFPSPQRRLRIWLLLFFALAKILATSLTLGIGGSSGAFAPPCSSGSCSAPPTASSCTSCSEPPPETPPSHERRLRTRHCASRLEVGRLDRRSNWRSGRCPCVS
ncbi:MAG: chloride channel protein [Microbacterium sp.]|nr:chloride channel protein [Microbacterium sp.]